jgi:hypothetical protein
MATYAEFQFPELQGKDAKNDCSAALRAGCWDELSLGHTREAAYSEIKFGVKVHSASVPIAETKYLVDSASMFAGAELHAHHGIDEFFAATKDKGKQVALESELVQSMQKFLKTTGITVDGAQLNYLRMPASVAEVLTGKATCK